MVRKEEEALLIDLLKTQEKLKVENELLKDENEEIKRLLTERDIDIDF